MFPKTGLIFYTSYIEKYCRKRKHGLKLCCNSDNLANIKMSRVQIKPSIQMNEVLSN